MQQLAVRGECLLIREARADDASSILALVPLCEDPAILRRLEHELSLAEELHLAGAVRPLAVERTGSRTRLALQDPGGEPLTKMIGPIGNPTQFLQLALAITVALAQVHARGLIHKDIQPANVLIDAGNRAHLTGFGFATRLSRERPSAEPQGILGTPAYMSPEQTGRMNRSVDSRSDLYSLGVTLYELLTGRLPFEAADPLEWIHCHMARVPPSPRERSNVPQPIADILLKLLAKSADDRYQTAAGLEADLRRCLEQWRTHGRIEPFQLGQRDLPDRVLVPESLYGREREIAALREALRGVTADGSPRVVLVSGDAGVGKSAIVYELQRGLDPSLTWFASGKSLQYQADVPCGTLIHACRGLVRQILMRPEAELQAWRAQFHDALQTGVGLIAALIPDLTAIMGSQPSAAAIAPQDFLNRFQLVFGRFLGVFARPGHPLVMFLDDMQWSDHATARLLGSLLGSAELRNLLLIVAYRNDEVDMSSPVTQLLEASRAAGIRTEELVVTPLASEDLGRLVGAALHSAPESVRGLTDLVYAKTQGNPFFASQFLTALEDEGLLQRDSASACWHWDEPGIDAKGFTDNVVQLLLAKLARLSSRSRELLQRLACMGPGAGGRVLSEYLGLPEPALEEAFREPVLAGLVIRTEDVYRFAHDRVQEAAYSLIAERERPALHLKLGRALLSQVTEAEMDERIFDIVGQLNRGVAGIEGEQERRQLAELNLQAGRRARQSTAYAAALSYFASARALLPSKPWNECPELVFALELHLGECEFLTGDLQGADERLRALASVVQDPHAGSAVACLRQTLYQILGRNDRAVEVCLAYLRQTGIAWPVHPSGADVAREYERVWKLLGERVPEDLLDLPLIEDTQQRAVLDVLAAVLAPALMTDWNLWRLVVGRMINISLQHGHGEGSTLAYCYFNIILGEDRGDYALGFRFGKLAVELLERRRLERYRARVEAAFGFTTVPWTQPMRTGIQWLRRSVRSAREAGDLTFACYSWFLLGPVMLSAGEPLEAVQAELESARAFARMLRFDYMSDMISGELGFVHALRGDTRGLTDFNQPSFDATDYERRLSEDPSLRTAGLWYWVHKLQAYYLAGEYTLALGATVQAEAKLWNMLSPLDVSDRHFYTALSLATKDRPASILLDADTRAAIAAHAGQLERLAANNPVDGSARARAVAAELARIEGRPEESGRLYEAAIRAAHDGGLLLDEAVALELAARHYRAEHLDTVADSLLLRAQRAYARWGAWGKVRWLEQRYSFLRELPGTGLMSTHRSWSASDLDWRSVIQATQAVSGEMVLGQLIETLLALALKHLGAQRGVIVLMDRSEPKVEAIADTVGESVKVDVHQQPITNTLPETILHYTFRTRELLLLDDAQTGDFASDSYVQRHRPRSVLCQPLVNRGRLMGAIYLENRLIAGAFTAPQMAVLEVLAVQAAISLENARLYADARERERRERRLLESNVVAIFFWGPNGSILDANDAFLSIIGYSREQMHAARLSWYDITPSKNHSRDQARAQQLALHGKPASQENEFIRRDGTRVPVLVGGALLEGSIDYGVAFVIDLTERHQAEQDRQARVTAEAANRAKSDFLANMSHELRTPLNGILGYAQILERDAQLAPRQRHQVKVIRDSGEHLLTLINDVLDLARIEAGKLELELVPVATRPFVDSLHELLRFKAEKKGLKLACEVAPGVPGAVGVDERRLRQVLLNLLSNALKFTDRGHVTLRLTRPAPTRLRFEVSDTGIGVSPEQMRLLFQPFQQAGTTQRRHEGTGLGLAISRQLVRLMGGDIQIDSRVGEGSRFWFELELKTAVPTASTSPTGRVATGYAGARKRLLVVDDVHDNRTVLIDLLVPLGFDVAAAGNAQEALELTQALPPDLVLTDWVMREMDGAELARRLRALPGMRDVPIVIVSARTSQPQPDPKLLLNTNAFVTKPVHVDELLETLGYLLRLEWTYAPEKAPPATGTPSPGSAPILPAEELQLLHRLAQEGDMRQIMQWCERGAALGEDYAEFVARVRALASQYQSQAVLQLVNDHLPKPANV